MILGVTGVYMAVAGIRGGWLDTLDKSLIFIPFYQAGILYKRELKERDQINTPVYLAFIGIIALVLIYYWGMVPAKGIAILSNFKMYMTYTLFLSAFLGIAFWLRLSRILAPAIGKSYYVNLIADNTWSIMMHEFIGFMLVKYIFYLLYLYTPFCHTFDATKFHHDIFYYYLPNNRYQMLILYMIAGVVIPLLIHSVVRRLQLKLIGTRWGKSFGSL